MDGGQHMVWSYQSFHNQQGQKTLFSGGHGAMGYALPAAIGAYYATGKPVACICGDGAFQMNIQELQWVKRENIPVKMIVMNNEALGMMAADFHPVIFPMWHRLMEFPQSASREKMWKNMQVSFWNRMDRSFWRSCWKTAPTHTRRPVWVSRSIISSLIYRNRYLMN